MSVSEALSSFFKRLDDAEIRYCVLHGWESLSERVDSDIDLIVAPGGISDLLQAATRAFEGRIVQLLQYGATSLTIVIDVKGGRVPHFLDVDVSTDYRLGGYIHFSGEVLLADRRRHAGLWVAHPRAELSYLFVKKVHKGHVPQHQRNRFERLRDELGPRRTKIIGRRIFGDRWGAQAVRWVEAGQWREVEKNISSLRRAMRRQVIKRDPLNPVRFWTAEVGRFWRRVRHPTGLWVVVMGPDGSGKSTLIRELESRLEGAFRRHRRFHFRPMFLPGRPGLSGSSTDPHRRDPYSSFVSVLKLGALALDFTVGHWLRVWPDRVRSGLILFDRYYDDLLVDPVRYRYGASSRWVRTLRSMVPQPDLWLLLDATPEVLRARKQEVSKGELMRQRGAYRDLLAECPEAVVLDAARSLEEVAGEATEAVLGHLERRYAHRRGVWLEALDPRAS